MAIVRRRIGDWRVRRTQMDSTLGLELTHVDGRVVIIELVGATSEAAEVCFRTITIDDIKLHVASLLPGENLVQLSLDRNARAS